MPNPLTQIEKFRKEGRERREQAASTVAASKARRERNVERGYRDEPEGDVIPEGGDGDGDEARTR